MNASGGSEPAHLQCKRPPAAWAGGLTVRRFKSNSRETLSFSVWPRCCALFERGQDGRVQPPLKKALRLAKRKNSAFPECCCSRKSKEKCVDTCFSFHRVRYFYYRKIFNQCFLRYIPGLHPLYNTRIHRERDKAFSPGVMNVLHPEAGVGKVEHGTAEQFADQHQREGQSRGTGAFLAALEHADNR